MTWIQTLEGHKVLLEQPDPYLISPETITVCLARKCRFGGHCKYFYSVAQHSVFVASLVPAPLKLAALLHDGHEVYSGFGDVLSPAKRLRADICQFLDRHTLEIDKAIAKRFRFNYELMHCDEVKHADSVALATEARDVMEKPPDEWMKMAPPSKEKIVPFGIPEAYRLFKKTLCELWTE